MSLPQQGQEAAGERRASAIRPPTLYEMLFYGETNNHD